MRFVVCSYIDNARSSASSTNILARCYLSHNTPYLISLSQINCPSQCCSNSDNQSPTANLAVYCNVAPTNDCLGKLCGTAVYDQCDVCDGDNTSCLDCNAVVNGAATYDVCDVCNGDGQSCRHAVTTTISTLLTTSDELSVRLPIVPPSFNKLFAARYY